MVLTTASYTLNSQFYQQTDSSAMRNTASSNTAEIYMHTHECNAISTALHPPKIWDQFVDDVYDILKKLFPSHQQSSSKYQVHHGGRK